jgi:rRNA processing protein Gar1
LAYRFFCRCDDGTTVLSPDMKEPVQKGTPLYHNAEKVGTVIETIGNVERPLVVARIRKEYADEPELQ